MTMSSKYQREIEDILKKAGGLEEPTPIRPPKNKRSIRRLGWLYVRQSLSGEFWSISPGRVMLFGLVLLLSTLVIRQFVSGVGAPLALLALLVMIAGYGMMLVKPPTLEKRWRQQPLDVSADSWWNRLRRKLK
jgi:hypothetical protein